MADWNGTDDQPLGDDGELVDQDAAAPGESTSAQVASTAARLLAMPNILMRASPYYGDLLRAIKNDSGHAATAKTLDLLDALALVIEPFMRDVRTVAGSALTQVESTPWEPDHDA